MAPERIEDGGTYIGHDGKIRNVLQIDSARRRLWYRPITVGAMRRTQQSLMVFSRWAARRLSPAAAGALISDLAHG